MPYLPVTGSRKRGILGGKNVNIANNMPIKQIIANATHDRIHEPFLCLKSDVSKRNAIPADIKNIVMLNQSGDLPKAPL